MKRCRLQFFFYDFNVFNVRLILLSNLILKIDFYLTHHITVTPDTNASLWSSVIKKKGLFARVKYVGQLDEQLLITLVEFVERILLDRPCDLPPTYVID